MSSNWIEEAEKARASLEAMTREARSTIKDLRQAEKDATEQVQAMRTIIRLLHDEFQKQIDDIGVTLSKQMAEMGVEVAQKHADRIERLITEKYAQVVRDRANHRSKLELEVERMETRLHDLRERVIPRDLESVDALLELAQEAMNRLDPDRKYRYKLTRGHPKEE